MNRIVVLWKQCNTCGHYLIWAASITSEEMNKSNTLSALLTLLSLLAECRCCVVWGCGRLCCCSFAVCLLIGYNFLLWYGIRCTAELSVSWFRGRKGWEDQSRCMYLPLYLCWTEQSVFICWSQVGLFIPVLTGLCSQRLNRLEMFPSEGKHSCGWKKKMRTEQNPININMHCNI